MYTLHIISNSTLLGPDVQWGHVTSKQSWRNIKKTRLQQKKKLMFATSKSMYWNSTNIGYGVKIFCRNIEALFHATYTQIHVTSKQSYCNITKLLLQHQEITTATYAGLRWIESFLVKLGILHGNGYTQSSSSSSRPAPPPVGLLCCRQPGPRWAQCGSAAGVQTSTVSEREHVILNGPTDGWFLALP